MKSLPAFSLLISVLSFFQGAHATEIPAVTASMEEFVNKGTVSGAVTLVAKGDNILHLSAVGKSNLSPGRPMQPNDLFWIASMTKPLVGVCVMMLQDEGKLSIQDPVEKYLPEFGNQWVVSESSGERKVLVKAERPITIFDLLTHTSGLGEARSPRPDCTLAELCAAYAHEPHLFQPGAKWNYSNEGINLLGRIIEVTSGQDFASFLNSRLLQPLHMNATTFWPTPSQVEQVAKSYERKPDGTMQEIRPFLMKGELCDTHRTPMAAGGLYSTASDIAQFYAMMLNGGSLAGKTYLRKETAAEMIRNQTGDIKAGFTPGIAWGLAFQVVKESNESGATAVLSPGTFGHGGAYATQSWADPKTGLIFVLLIQQTNLGDASDIRKAFQATATKTLTGENKGN